MNWPTGLGLSGSDAVAAYVKNTPGAIGFVELVYEHPQDAVKAKELVAFLIWAETEGQKMVRELNFAPLPENVQSRILTEIKSISSGG